MIDEAKINSSEPAVICRGLRKKFGEFVAVDGISFSIERGDVFGFLGPNGSGKSTTIRMLCGIISPTEGEGKVLGFDIYRQQAQIRSRIGYMSQRFSLYDDLTVEENLLFYAGTYSVRGGEFAEMREFALQMSGLKGRERELAVNLSGGWKQRLALSCAVLHKPQMLFLDEPTGGVDPNSRRNFWDLIYQLSSMGVTIFVTTHYMDEAEHCDKLSFILDGRIIAVGSPSELKRNILGGDVFSSNLEDVFVSLMQHSE